MEDAVFIFGFKASVFIVITRDALHVPSKVKDIILHYPSITQVMVEPHCEILWSDNSGEGLGASPQKIIDQD